MIFFDNQYVEGSNLPVIRTDDEGNTYQERALPDGSRHEVLKNFPSDDELRAAVGMTASIRRFDYFWYLEYSV